MITLSIKLNGQSKALEEQLRKALEPVLRNLETDGSVFISVREGGSTIMFSGVNDEAKAEITSISDNILNVFYD